MEGVNKWQSQGLTLELNPKPLFYLQTGRPKGLMCAKLSSNVKGPCEAERVEISDAPRGQSRT